jgi:hypothetical protein
MKLSYAKHIIDCPDGWGCETSDDMIIYTRDCRESPAIQKIILTFNNGRLRYKDYLENGLLHREDGPAVIVFGSEGEIVNTCYYFRGVPTRKDGK